MAKKHTQVVRDLQTRFGSLYGPEEAETIVEILRRDAPTCGPEVAGFQSEFAAYVGVKHAVAVTNCTAALELALTALGVGPGDEVITTPLTWIATANAIATRGATVVLADVDPRTLNLDPDAAAAKITPRTRAIMPVHLYGQCVDIAAFMTLAERHGLAIVEDAAHAPGGEYNGRKTGSLGHIGCFSFHEQKNMSTLGEGGMVTTDDDQLAERVLLYRSHCCRVFGGSLKYPAIDETKVPRDDRFWWVEFEDAGYNVRMTDIQAAVGRVQLRKLDALNARRIANARYLSARLAEIKGLTPPYVSPKVKHVFHLYPVLVNSEEFGLCKTELMRRLFDEYGIRSGTHYIPVNWTTAYKNRGHREGECPVAEAAFEKLVTLPIHPRLTEEDLDYMAEAIESLGRSHRGKAATPRQHLSRLAGSRSGHRRKGTTAH
jgi:perosamine synthetase